MPASIPNGFALAVRAGHRSDKGRRAQNRHSRHIGMVNACLPYRAKSRAYGEGRVNMDAFGGEPDAATFGVPDQIGPVSSFIATEGLVFVACGDA
jgi:hypothetical protein